MMTDDELSGLLQQLERSTPSDTDALERVFGDVDAERRKTVGRHRRYLGLLAVLDRLRWSTNLHGPVPAALLIAGLLIAALSVGLLVGALAQPRPPIPQRLDAPLLIRPATVQIKPGAEVSISGRPGRLAVYDGSVWVADGGALTRIDPARGTVLSTEDIGSGRLTVAAGPAGLWVASLEEGTVRGPIETTAADAPSIPVERPEYLAVGADDIWVSSPGTGNLTRILASTGRVVAIVPLGNAPSGITLTDREVLVGHDHSVVDAAPGPHDGAITIVDRVANVVIDDIPVTSGFGYVRDILIVGGDLWYVDANIGSLVRVDRANMSSANVIAVAERIEGATMTDGLIWMTINPSGEHSALVGYDPAAGGFTAALGPADLAPSSTVGLGAVASFDGSLWVAADWPSRRAILRVEIPG
jgi:hypothetical protein